jgi:hypothetical protein
MLELTSDVPNAACWMLREISCVAAPCSSIAAAMVDATSESRSMVPLICLIAVTAPVIPKHAPNSSHAR